jgi:hypothetical protein
MDRLTDKLLAVVLDHFAGRDDPLDVNVEFMIALASIAAAVIGEDQANAKQRRAVFDDLVTKGLDQLASKHLDTMGH